MLLFCGGPFFRLTAPSQETLGARDIHVEIFTDIW